MLKTHKAISNPEVNDVFDIFEVSETLVYLYAQVGEINYLTPSDHQFLQSVLLKENLPEEESRIINRILYSVRRGWIKLVEELHPSSGSSNNRRILRVLESVA